MSRLQQKDPKQLGPKGGRRGQHAWAPDLADCILSSMEQQTQQEEQEEQQQDEQQQEQQARQQASQPAMAAASDQGC